MRYTASVRVGHNFWVRYYSVGATFTLRGMHKQLNNCPDLGTYEWRIKDNKTGKFYYHI